MKNFIERYAEKKLTTKEEPKKDEVKKEDKSEQKSEAKSDEKKDEAKDGKPAEEQKDKQSEEKSEDKKSEPDEAKATKLESKQAEPQKEPASAPAPARPGYTGTGDITGVKDFRQEVIVNGDVTVKQFGGSTIGQIGQKLDAFAESLKAIEFTRAEEESFRNGDALYELRRSREEGEVPGAAVKFAELVFLKCPKKASKFIRDHISEAIEADPELISFIREVDARKHKIEHRFRPFRAEVATELWDEATARPYITEQKAGLPPRLAENARDEDFGTWVLVELNADTGAIRELSAEEVKVHEIKQSTAKPEGKKKAAKKPPKEPEGEA